MAPAMTNPVFVDGGSCLPSAFAIDPANPYSRHPMHALNGYFLVFIGGGVGVAVCGLCAWSLNRGTPSAGTTHVPGTVLLDT